MSEAAREDFEDLDEVWLGNGDIAVDGEEFVEALYAVDRLADRMGEIQSELADLNTGLEREDAIRLIYAKNHRLNVTDVEKAFDAIDALADGDPMEAGQRLLSLNTDLTIEEAGQVLNEMGELAEKYAPEDNS